jgi:gamma-glutamylcyclotransferase (GGCT)/AIG2-like uncharacterized protein YtfP
MKLFVYGSLLSGEEHHWRLAGSTRLGACRTAARYTLVDLGEYPALLRRGNTSVCGEVYEVDAKTLAALDTFEGHPLLFRRISIRIMDGQMAVGYALWQTGLARERPIIASGDWKQRAVRGRKH